jgi:hypothetical protein
LLLLGLRERGLAVGPDDAARLAAAFRHGLDWPHRRRVRALKALLARTDEERRVIDQLAPFLFVEAEKAPDDIPRQEAPPETPLPRARPLELAIAPPDSVRAITPREEEVSRRRRRRRRSALAGAALGAAVAVLVWRSLTPDPTPSAAPGPKP